MRPATAAAVAAVALALWGWARVRDPPTATGLLAASLALVLLRDEAGPASRRGLGVVAGGATATLGALALAMPLLGWRLALGNPGALGTMSLNAAACLFFLGLALAVIDLGPPERPWPQHPLLLLVASLSLLTLLGRAYTVVPFARAGEPQPMTLSSALAFGLIALGAAWARPRRGFLAVLGSASSGGVLARQLLPAAIAIPLALSWLRLAGQQAGLFGVELGVALTAVATVILMTYVVALATSALDQADRERRQAEEAVRTLNRSLEASVATVRERTVLLEEANRFLGEANEELEKLAGSDGLTGLANRRGFKDRLDLEWDRALRSRQPLSLLMLDVDDFKAYNDLYGHPAGDLCLKRVAGALAALARRAPDLAARYGGEEFALLLPETPREGALRVAEEARAGILALGIAHHRSRAAPMVTVSVGVASLVPRAKGESPALVETADQALYRAKA
ncbi:MAG TPA: diguanylate cyclase, partial [Vicinamibacteria bacterium]|nr:diguanylate cyclase [Vicinamibacteria bacterium]